MLSGVGLSATPGTVARQAPLSLGFSRQEYWSGLPFSSPGDLPDPGIEPRLPAFQPDSLLTELPGKPLFWVFLQMFLSVCDTLLPFVSYSALFIELSSDPGIEPASPASQADSSLLSRRGSPKGAMSPPKMKIF